MPTTTTADSLRWRAVKLRQQASAIGIAEAWGLRRRAGEDVWVGPAARAFLDDLAVAESKLASAIDTLTTAARHLDVLADQAEATARVELAARLGLS